MMKRLLLTVVAIVSVLTFSFARVAFASTYTLSGVVKDGSGNPIAGVDVNSSLDASTVAETDSSGFYSLQVSGGYQDIQATPPVQSGFSAAIAKNQNITASTALNFTLTNANVVSFSGHIKNQAGEVLSNQTVYISTTSQTIASTSTDSSGYFSLQLAPGEYKVDVTNYYDKNNYSKKDPGYYTLTLGTNFSLNQSVMMDIVLPTHKTTLHIVNKFGIAVPNASVATNYVNWSGSLAGISATGLSGDAQSQTTDAYGNVDVYLFPGNYSITINPPAGSTDYVITSVAGVDIGSVDTQDLTIQSPSTLEGVITDSSGTPLPYQTIYVSTPSATIASATTDAQGKYKLQVSAGTYKVDITNASHQNDFSLHVPGYYYLTLSNNYLIQNDTTLNVAIPAKQVKVHVENQNGTAVEGATVRTAASASWSGVDVDGYSSSGTTTYSRGPVTDAAGDTTLWLIPTTYSLAVDPPSGSNYSLTTESGVSVTVDTSVSIVLSGTVTLSGAVYDSQGDTLPYQTVYLSTPGETIAAAETDANGEYRLDVAPDIYKLDVNNLNHTGDNTLSVPDNYAITISNSYSLSNDTSFNITLPFKKVSMLVQGQVDEPLSNVKVTSADSQWSGSIGQYASTGYSEYTHPVITNSSGQATLWLLPSSYEFVATPPSDSHYGTAVLSNVTISSDQTEIISLQLNLPSAPTALQADSPSQQPVLSWGAVSGDVSYDVYRDGTKIDSSTSASYVDTSATDGTHSYYVTAVNAAGESSPSNTVSVLVDNTKPTITYIVSPAANSSGWNNSDVTVTFTCTDGPGGSGISSCSDPINVSTQGSQTVTGTATDKAGNASTVNPSVKIDKLAPIVGAPTWNANPVTVGNNTSFVVAANDDTSNTSDVSGVVGGEYFLGTDPGVGNATALSWDGTNLSSSTFGASLTPGVYNIGIRAKDAAGNWSSATTVYLVVFNPAGPGYIVGQQNVAPTSTALLPWISTSNKDFASFGFNVKYTSTGTVDPASNFNFNYDEKGNCNSPGSPDCHTFDLVANSFDWLGIGGTNNSDGTFQGTGTLTINGVAQTVIFRIEAIDGDQLTPKQSDSFTLKIYNQGSNPQTDNPLYHVSADFTSGTGNANGGIQVKK
jgi:hypothetical protein